MKYFLYLIDMLNRYILRKNIERMISQNKYEKTKKRAERLMKIFLK